MTGAPGHGLLSSRSAQLVGLGFEASDAAVQGEFALLRILNKSDCRKQAEGLRLDIFDEDDGGGPALQQDSSQETSRLGNEEGRTLYTSGLTNIRSMFDGGPAHAMIRAGNDSAAGDDILAMLVEQSGES
jgi:hypothetical protein